MDPFTLSVLTYLLITLGVWAGGIVFTMLRLMYKTKKFHERIRRADIWQLLTLLLVTGSVFFVVFIYPGLIHMIPSTLAVLEIGSIPFLAYLTETNWTNLKRLPAS